MELQTDQIQYSPTFSKRGYNDTQNLSLSSHSEMGKLDKRWEGWYVD